MRAQWLLNKWINKREIAVEFAYMHACMHEGNVPCHSCGGTAAFPRIEFPPPWSTRGRNSLSSLVFIKERNQVNQVTQLLAEQS